MPLDDADGDRFVWPVTSDGGKQEIGRLCNKFFNRGKCFLPKVRLESGGYNNKKFHTYTHIPVLTPMAWVPLDDGKTAPPITGAESPRLTQLPVTITSGVERLAQAIKEQAADPNELSEPPLEADDFPF